LFIVVFLCCCSFIAVVPMVLMTFSIQRWRQIHVDLIMPNARYIIAFTV